MVDAHDAPHIPRGVLLGAGALLVLTLALTAAARLSQIAHPAPRAAPLARVEVRFEDRADGSIVMLDPSGARSLATVPPGTNGFVRGVLRGMFRERKLESLGRTGVFRIERGADGRLTLDDPSTGRRVDLGAFGPTNAASFERLFDAAREATR